MNWGSLKEHFTERLESMKLVRILTMVKKYLVLHLIFAAIFLFQSCGMKLTVSTTGGTIDPRAKTAYIATFPNNATLVNPTLSQTFTNALKDRIQSQTPLSIINSQNADYSLSGEIISYTITPIAIQGNDVAAMNRLTIVVRVKFINKFDESQNFEQTFSRFADYLSSQNFTSIESTLITTVNEALTEEIFNKAFVNW